MLLTKNVAEGHVRTAQYIQRSGGIEGVPVSQQCSDGSRASSIGRSTSKAVLLFNRALYNKKARTLRLADGPRFRCLFSEDVIFSPASPSATSHPSYTMVAVCGAAAAIGIFCSVLSCFFCLYVGIRCFIPGTCDRRVSIVVVILLCMRFFGIVRATVEWLWPWCQMLCCVLCIHRYFRVQEYNIYVLRRVRWVKCCTTTVDGRSGPVPRFSTRTCAPVLFLRVIRHSRPDVPVSRLSFVCVLKAK